MRKKVYGVLAIAPICILLLNVLIVGIGAGGEALGIIQGELNRFLLNLATITSMALLIAVISVYVTIVLFIVDACKNSHFTKCKKILWGIILYCCNIFVFPIYWYRYIYKDWNEEREARRPDLSILWVLVPGVSIAILILSFIFGILAPTPFLEEVALYVFTFVLLFAITVEFMTCILFIVHVCLNSWLFIEKKIMWIILFVFFNLIAFAIYWKIHIYVRPNDQKTNGENA